jgi:hypothetical protein
VTLKAFEVTKAKKYDLGLADEETNTTLLLLEDVHGGKPVSKEMMERGSEASVTTIAVCVVLVKRKTERFRNGGNVDILIKQTHWIKKSMAKERQKPFTIPWL